MNILKQTKNRNKFYALALAMIMVIMSIMPAQAFAWSFTNNPVDTGIVKLYFGDPDYSEVVPESLTQFVKTSNSPLTYHATYIGSDSANYYPDSLLLVVRPNSGTLSTAIVREDGVTAIVPALTTGVYDIDISKTATTREFEFTASIGGPSQTIIITFDQPKDIQTGTSNLFAYLPAPAQFVNEGMGIGGWGDAYSSAGDLKFGGNPTGTGVSLGSFGGYAVFDFGATGIDNNPNNKYGADFIVYGNAFWANSEAGAIQVAQDNGSGKPGTWYNIAGSDYYKSDVVRNYKVTYADPNPGNTTTLASVPFVPRDAIGETYPQTWTGNGLVDKNSYHNHSWFPQAVNYFANRAINSKTCQPVDKIADLSFVNRVPDGIDLSYTDGTLKTVTDTSLLEFEGVKYVSNGTITGNTQFLFGYADVHPNRTSNFTTAYNPYSLYSVANNTQYNAATANTGGGNPIDISWAVDANGNPIHLDEIRFVRVYTGVQQMNGAFGEISTEVLGLKPVDPTGASVGVTAAATLSYLSTTYTPVAVSGSSTQGITTITQINSSRTYTINTSATYTYVNNELMSSTSLKIDLNPGETKLVRLITQSGNEEAYVNLVKFTRP